VYGQLQASGKLPSPTGVVLEVLQIANNEESSVEDIASVVARDPAMAARILKVVNSPWAGAGRKTETILEAVKLLGTRIVISLALGFSLISRYRNGACSAFDYEKFWGESFIGAVAARHTACRFGSQLQDQAYACRLLSKIGRLAFATTCPKEYTRILTGIDSDDTTLLAETERNAFGIDHNELAARMMVDWHLPEMFSAAAREQDSASTEKPPGESRVEQMAWTLRLSTIIASALVNRSSLEALAATVCAIGVDPREYPRLIRSVGLEWEESASLFSLPAQAAPDHEDLYAAANRYLVGAYEVLHNEAVTDELTQLGNRRAADARLGEYWVASSRYGHPLACLLFDLDNFKSINDLYGHAVGDEVLRKSAEVLRGRCRADEPAFRIGGEEFLVLCPHSTSNEAVVVARRIREVLAETAIATAVGPLRITLSAGVAERTKAMNGPEALLATADEALYTAKRAGRNRVQVAGRPHESNGEPTSPAGAVRPQTLVG